ncbi:MAG: DNA repair protein RecN [Coriobacteriia bacterium]|nr:DNA repair protein RecN [Coriobacteriia bacterium]
MLDELHVRDLALIREAWLEFGPGMTVLSGETGAGKTALLGALKLLLGERADSGAVRDGAPEATVEGRFRAGERELIARRRVSADGRSRCTLDDEMATVGALAERIGPLVDLHGQHEHQALLSPATHVGYLDRRAGESARVALEEYRTAREAHRAAITSRDELAVRMAEAAKNADYLRFVAEEIGRVDPVPGEDAALEARLPALQHGERLAEAAGEATRILRADGGALDSVARAQATLLKTVGVDPALDALAARLGEVSALTDDVSAELRSYRDGIEHDADALDRVLARLSALSGLTRKYGPTLDDVIAARDAADEALAAADAGDEARLAADAAVGAAQAQLQAAADRLTAVREEAVPGFVAALADAVAELAMDGTRFEVDIAALPFDAWTADGPHRVEFLYAPAAAQKCRPLSRIASGGEISRVMLALKGVLGAADSVETLVFDEVDAGIGGATATAVGRRLAQLGRGRQVIVVTHLAQVAVFADAHLVVSKEMDGGDAATTVTRVDGGGRVAEIARMLSGNDSDAGLAHAEELLQSVEHPAR